MDGITSARTEGWMDRLMETDKNYIPLWHTSIAGGIKTNEKKTYLCQNFAQ